MAYDEGHAQTLREALADQSGLSERRMFGGLCFMLHGNMVCGVHRDGTMFRVGKAAEAQALALPGIRPLGFTGRPMGGMVESDEDLLGDPVRLEKMIEMSLAYARTLPPK